MSKEAFELIKRRRSVRTFDGRALEDADRKKLDEYLKTLSNPFGIGVTFRILDAEEHGLSSPVTVGAKEYLAAKVSKKEMCEAAFGYEFEKACLFALSLGIGTVILAASMNRAAFEKATDVGEDEIMPAVSPLGYAAKKMSLRETVMRKGIKADSRVPFEKLFFKDSFEKALDTNGAGRLFLPLEAVRLAPSAANRQPWRALVVQNAVCFFIKRSMKYGPAGDFQKIDMGIALSHFETVAKEEGIQGSFAFEAPAVEAPDGLEFIASFVFDN